MIMSKPREFFSEDRVINSGLSSQKKCHCCRHRAEDEAAIC